MNVPKDAQTKAGCQNTGKPKRGIALPFLHDYPSYQQIQPESHEGRECHKCPEPHVSPESLVSPVSEGQDVEAELKGLAERNGIGFLDRMRETHVNITKRTFLQSLQKFEYRRAKVIRLTRRWRLFRNFLFRNCRLYPRMPKASERLRRIAGLHCELSRLCGNRKYFLSYRDASKVCKNLSAQEAHTLTAALVRLGVIRIVSRGKASPKGGEAAEFRYL